jgi:hypothetical protein
MLCHLQAACVRCKRILKDIVRASPLEADRMGKCILHTSRSIFVNVRKIEFLVMHLLLGQCLEPALHVAFDKEIGWQILLLVNHGLRISYID